MESFIGRSQDIFAVRERRKRILMIVAACAACAVAATGIAALLINAFLNKKYSSYDVVWETDAAKSGYAAYSEYGGKALKYSRDGISAIDSEGNTAWNGSYDMISPKVDVCGDYAVVADIGEKSFIVYDGAEAGKEMETDYPILQACVSNRGIVAVLLEQPNSNVINIYNPYDVSESLLVEIPTNVDEGYPVCIDISPGGANLAAAYVCVASGKLQSRVAFYDFSDVGKNTNSLVGAKNYDGGIISEVRFLNDENICIFNDTGFGVWGNAKKPKEIYEKSFKTPIKSAFCNEKYVGMIFEDEKDGRFRVKAYDMSGKKELDMTFNDEYASVDINSRNEIMISSASHCAIFRMNGVRRFSCDVDGKLLYFLPSEKMNRYYFVMDGKIQCIKLKK